MGGRSNDPYYEQLILFLRNASTGEEGTGRSQAIAAPLTRLWYDQG